MPPRLRGEAAEEYDASLARRLAPGQPERQEQLRRLPLFEVACLGAEAVPGTGRQRQRVRRGEA
jgi:hypothetical protein